MSRARFARRTLLRLALFVAAAVAALVAGPAAAQAPLTIAVPVSLSGGGEFYGAPVLDGARLAVEEANAQRGEPPIELVVHDDRSTDSGAREAARAVIASAAVAAVGPALTTASLAAGGLYADANLASIVPTAHGDAVTDAATSFRPIFSTSQMGQSLANYVAHVLRARRAIVLFRDNGFGRPIAEGFASAGERLGLQVDRYGFANAAERQELVRAVAAGAENAAVVLGMLNDDAVPLLVALRRIGIGGAVLGPSALAGESFAALFRDFPEERASPGIFTNNVYAATPIALDSASAETLLFAARFRRRFGVEPSWSAVQGYDAMRLAIAAVRAAAGGSGDLAVRRLQVVAWLSRLDDPALALPALTGPMWFTPERGRTLPIRVGRFHGGIFESAPLQLVPVATPDLEEIRTGAVVEIGRGRYARRQMVVTTGIFVNEIPRVDIAQGSFTADFYLWLRYAAAAGPGAADPTDLEFPELVRGAFDPRRLAGEGLLDDGTAYRLWRLRGDFKNDYDLRRYPYDRQTLAIRLFNGRAASDRIVYVRDRRDLSGLVAAGQSGDALLAGAAPAAFRNLTQWDALRVDQRRDVLVTPSALGDPRLVGIDRQRELSGFRLEVELRRRTFATLVKTLLPLGIMALIMLASLWFPPALVKEKITVVITAALSGAVLLGAVNAQLGTVGYTMAVEYVFYIFFGLCLLSIVSVLAAERLRVGGRGTVASRAELLTRALYLLALVSIVVTAWAVAGLW